LGAPLALALGSIALGQNLVYGGRDLVPISFGLQGGAQSLHEVFDVGMKSLM
jgi:hypothetical protein